MSFVLWKSDEILHQPKRSSSTSIIGSKAVTKIQWLFLAQSGAKSVMFLLEVMHIGETVWLASSCQSSNLNKQSKINWFFGMRRSSLALSGLGLDYNKYLLISLSLKVSGPHFPFSISKWKHLLSEPQMSRPFPKRNVKVNFLTFI